MATCDDVDSIAVVERRTAVIIFGGHFGKAEIDIDGGERVGGIKDALGGVNSDVGTQLHEKLVLHLIDTILGIEHQSFVFFEIGHDIAFAVGERLAAGVLGRDAIDMRVGDFDEVAIGPVVTNFERIDAGAFALALLQVGDPLATILGGGFELVEFGAEAGAHDAAFGDTDRRLVDDSLLDESDDVLVVGEALHKLGKRLILSGGAGSLLGKRRLDFGGGAQTAGERDEIAGRSDALAHAINKALNIAGLLKGFGEPGLQNRITEQF